MKVQLRWGLFAHAHYISCALNLTEWFLLMKGSSLLVHTGPNTISTQKCAGTVTKLETYLLVTSLTVYRFFRFQRG